MDIWADCRDAVVPVALEGELIRFVESQEKIATNALVDNLDEQWLLEEMLEASKPPPARILEISVADLETPTPRPRSPSRRRRRRRSRPRSRRGSSGAAM